ncbi:MAG: thioredoxin family protein [Leptolyngbyaceae cyanobacterium SM1_4_3]|nr:thioredoxin family protein [Leptolyngbyaceae cyanobacterium SM1_4_3]NJN91726.1 thioredoxin family protein [Leptolyngbyaceae cyanobacterium SL_5_14]
MQAFMEKTKTPVGSYAPDFELPGADGMVHHLARYLETVAVGVIFMGNHCPYVHLYLNRLKQIQADFQNQGFTLIGINANDDQRYPDDSFENMKRFVAEQRLNFPYLRDVTQDVAKTFGAERTPEAFLIDRSGILRYSGLIDDHAQDSGAVRVNYLRDAIAQLLLNGSVTVPSTHAAGCSVKWRQ